MAKRRKLPKAQRRAIANENLAKARRLRWKGHHKKIKRKLSKAERYKIAMRNMRKAWAVNPKHGHKRKKR